MNRINVYIMIAALGLGLLGCSPSVMLPPVQEPLDSVAWKNCAQEAEERAGRSMIDDLKMDSDMLLCQGVVMATADADDKEKVDEAVEMLTEAALLDKADHRAYYVSGRVLTAAGRYEEALTAFARSKKRYPEMEVPTVRLGNLVLEKNGEEEALIFLKRANERDVCNYGCKGLLAELYHRTDKTAEALKMYEAMIDENPAEPEAYVGLAKINNSGKAFIEEAKYLKKAINATGFEALPKETKAALYHSRAFSLYNAGAFAEAKKMLGNATRYKDSAEWTLLGGWIQMKLGDPAMALIRFEKAVDMDKKLVAAHIGIGDASKALGQMAEAAAAYKKAAYLAPINGIVKLKLSAVYCELGEFDKAQIQLRDATQLGTDKLPKELLQQITSAISAHEAGSAKSK